MGRVVIVAVAILLTFNIFIDIGPILAGAGILGLAVSFGAQSLVKDVISGFFILFENQFAVGDVIEAAGKSGTVERMTLRVVVLRDVYGVLHVIPNGEIKVVSNKTRGWSRAVIDVSVAYDVDVDRALDVVSDEAARFSADPKWKHELDGAGEVLGVESVSDNSVVIRALIRTRPGSQWSVAREFRRRMKARLDREQIEIPDPAVPRCPRRTRCRRCPRKPRPAARRRMTLHLYNTLTPPGRALHPAPPGAGHALHLRPDGLQLRPHRELPDLPVRGPAAALARGERVRGVPHHEPHRCGRPDHRGRARRGVIAQRRTSIPSPRRSSRIATTSGSGRRTSYPRATEYIAPDDRAGRGPARQGGRVQGRGRLGVLRDRPVPGLRPAVAARSQRELKAGASGG